MLHSVIAPQNCVDKHVRNPSCTSFLCAAATWLASNACLASRTWRSTEHRSLSYTDGARCFLRAQAEPRHAPSKQHAALLYSWTQGYATTFSNAPCGASLAPGAVAVTSSRRHKMGHRQGSQQCKPRTPWCLHKDPWCPTACAKAPRWRCCSVNTMHTERHEQLCHPSRPCRAWRQIELTRALSGSRAHDSAGAASPSPAQAQGPRWRCSCLDEVHPVLLQLCHPFLPPSRLLKVTQASSAAVQWELFATWCRSCLPRLCARTAAALPPPFACALQAAQWEPCTSWCLR